MTPPKRICELRDLEIEQAERGAGFLGMLPDQVPGDLAVPNDLGTSLYVAVCLSEIRRTNLKALAETMPQYTLAFAGNEFDPGSVGDVPRAGDSTSISKGFVQSSTSSTFRSPTLKPRPRLLGCPRSSR